MFNITPQFKIARATKTNRIAEKLRAHISAHDATFQEKPLVDINTIIMTPPRLHRLKSIEVPPTFTTNLIICTFSGQSPKYSSSVFNDRHNYLKYNLHLLNTLNTNITQITIMCPYVENMETIQEYYNTDNIILNNIKDKIVFCNCDNMGISYGQFIHGIKKYPNFDYYIFTEDDYVPFTDYFESTLVNSYLSKNKMCYLCLYVREIKMNINSFSGPDEYFSLKNKINSFGYIDKSYDIADFSIGILSAKCVDNLIRKFSNFENIIDILSLSCADMNRMWAAQVVFSIILDMSNIDILGLHDMYIPLFYNTYTRDILICNNQSDIRQIPLFIPMDIFYPNNFNSIIPTIQNNCDPLQFNDTFTIFNENKINAMKLLSDANSKKTIYFPKIDHFGIFYTLFSSINYNLKNIYNCMFISHISEISVQDGDILFLIPQFCFDYLNDNIKTKNITFIVINTEPLHLTDNFSHIMHISQYTNNKILLLEYMSKNMIYYSTKDLLNIQIYYIPFTYNKYTSTLISPNLSKKTTDIYFYGYINPRREKILHSIKMNGYNILYNYNNTSINGYDIYQHQYNIIKTSKIIINIYQHDKNKCFDYYRFTILLSNKIFFITEEFEIDKDIELLIGDYKDYIITFNENNLYDVINTCLNYTQEERDSISEKAYKWYKHIDNFDDNITNLLYRHT
jgi:hypothetical protein